MRWALLMSLGVTGGCASLLGIDTIDIDPDAGPGDDGAVTPATVTVEVLEGAQPIAGVDVLFHQGSELVAVVRTNNEGIAEAELGAQGLVTIPSSAEDKTVLRSVVVAPGDRVRHIRDVSLPAPLSITVPQPSSGDGVGVFAGSSLVAQLLASDLPTTTTASEVPFSAVGPNGELVVWAVAVDAMSSRFVSTTYAVIDLDNAEPLQLPPFAAEPAFTGSVTGLVAGNTNQVSLNHIVADVLIPADAVETTASAVQQGFIADPTIAGGFDFGVVDSGGGNQPADTHEVRLRLPASELSAEIDFQAESLSPLESAAVETAGGAITARWSPYPSDVELCIAEITFVDSQPIASWTVEAPASAGAVTLPPLPGALGLTDLVPASAAMTIQDFSGFASYAEHRAVLPRHPAAPPPAEGTLRRTRRSVVPIDAGD